MTENELLNFIKQSIEKQGDLFKKLSEDMNSLDKKIDRLESHIDSEIGQHGYLPRQLKELGDSLNSIKITLFGDGMNNIGVIRQNDALENRIKVLESNEEKRKWWMQALIVAVLGLIVRMIWTWIATAS